MILPNAIGYYAASGSSLPQLANMVFWGDASTLAGGDGAAIGSFTDRSGHGNHATAAGNLRPLLKLNIVNGKAVLRFDGQIGEADIMDWPDLFGAATTGTLIAVLKNNADPAEQTNTSAPWRLSKTAGVGNSGHPYTDGFIYEHFGSDISIAGMPKPSSAALFHAYGVTIQANKMVVYWNGVIIGGQDLNSPGFMATPTLGGAAISKFRGDVAEIILYKVVLSLAEMKAVNTYLAAKYAVSVADVTSAPSPQAPSRDCRAGGKQTRLRWSTMTR